MRPQRDRPWHAGQEELGQLELSSKGSLIFLCPFWGLHCWMLHTSVPLPTLKCTRIVEANISFIFFSFKQANCLEKILIF